MSSAAKLWLRAGEVRVLGQRLVHVVVVDEADVDLAAADGGDDGAVVGERERRRWRRCPPATRVVASSPSSNAHRRDEVLERGVRRGDADAPRPLRLRRGRGRSSAARPRGTISGLKASTRLRPENADPAAVAGVELLGDEVEDVVGERAEQARAGRGSRRRRATARGTRRPAPGRPPPRSAGRGRTCCRSAPRRRCRSPRRSGRGSARRGSPCAPSR